MKKNKANGKVGWLNDHGRAMSKLFNLSYELKGIADAFFATGNENMGKTLYSISNEIMSAHETANRALSESINETIVRSDEHTKTILLASLAGIQLATEGKECKEKKEAVKWE